MISGTPLTKREYEILRLRSKGMPIKAVAAYFGSSDQTIKNQSLSAFRKLGVLGLNEALCALGFVTTNQSRALIDRLLDLEHKHYQERIAFLRSLTEPIFEEEA